MEENTTIAELIKALELHASTHPDGMNVRVDIDLTGLEYRKISDIYSDANGIHLMSVKK